LAPSATIPPLRTKPTPISKKSSSRAPRSTASRLRRRLAYLLAFLAASYIAYETVPPARHLLVALIRCTRLLTAVTANIIDYKWMFAKHYDPAVYTEEEIKEFRRGDRRECHKRSAGRLFEALKRNAGIYVKLGQHISSIQALPKE
jgi:aarF domain-containing kinase